MLMITDEPMTNDDVLLAAHGACEFCWNDVQRVREFATAFVFTCGYSHDDDIRYTHGNLGGIVNEWQLSEFYDN